MTNSSSSLIACAVSALLSASTAAMAGPSTEFPTYTVGPQSNGSYVMSTGQIITPAGTVINLTDNLTSTVSPVRAESRQSQLRRRTAHGRVVRGRRDQPEHRQDRSAIHAVQGHSRIVHGHHL